jgi:CHAT domain-containing protein/tetratricopeptide (TPR) repeat protein
MKSFFGIISVGIFVIVRVCTAQSWIELEARSDSLAKAGDFSAAAATMTEALSIAEAQLKPMDNRIAELLELLGKYHYALAKYTETEPLWKRALDIWERTTGPNTADAGRVLCNLSILKKAMGQYSEAESLCRKALELRERNLGPDAPDVAASLNNLANLLLVQARYAEAETDYQRALDITERSRGEDDPQVAISLNNLAALYHMLGRYSDEEPLYRRSLDIMTKAHGPQHPDVAQALNNLGYLYHDMGAYDKAEPLYQQALTIEETTQGQEHPKVAATLGNLARLYSDKAQYDMAEMSIRRALAISEKTQGGEHPEVAEMLITLGDILQLQGRDDDAAETYTRSLAIFEKSVGKLHPLEARDLFGLAMLAKSRSDFEKAKQYESRAFSIRRKNFSEGFAVMAERNALEYSRFFQEESSNYLTILLDCPDGANVNRAEIARVVLSTKGQVSDGIFMRHKSVNAIAALVDSLNDARQVLSKLYVEGPDPTRKWAYSTDLSRAAERKERFEADLARQSEEMRNEKIMSDIAPAAVTAALPPNAAMVDIIRYEHRLNLHESENRYLAVVLKSGGKVGIFELGPASAIDSAVERYRNHFRKPSQFDLNRDAYVRASDGVYRMVWQPLTYILQDAKVVFIAPDGDLSLVSYAGLLDTQGSFLIEQHAFHYLLSGRDLLEHVKARPPRVSGMLAMGNPDYDAAPSARRGSTGGRILSSLQSALASKPPQNVTSGCRILRDTQVSRLPGTRIEIERTTNQWEETHDEPAIRFMDAMASEENLKQNCHGKQVVHLATHGYYISDQCLPEHAGPGYIGESPLLQSGLFLAGSNLMGRGAGEAGAEDGIVTAEEVSSLNLQGTQLVILSACETGVGEVKSGEGVFGLRRAFQMAGARTIVSALWAVDDESAVDIIGQLFTNEQESVADAIRDSTLRRIGKLRSAGKSDDPFFWASFVATGDWQAR